jgi:hypothetical protein
VVGRGGGGPKNSAAREGTHTPAMTTALYSIKFDFLAEEPTELSVSEGEMVRAPARAHESSEPWTLVETDTPPFNRGFVPTSYLRVAAAAVASFAPRPPASPAASQEGEEYVVDTRAGGPVRRLSDPRLSHHLLEALTINPPEEHLPAGPNSNSSTSRLMLRSSSEFSHFFAQHDGQFQQVMHMRHEQFRALEDATEELKHRLEAARNKSVEIADAMTEINSVIEAERRRWKERLAEESTSIYQ